MVVDERTTRVRARSGPSSRRRRRRPHYHRLAIALGVLALLLIGVLALASFAEHVAYSGRVLPGVHVDGVSVAGHKDDAAASKVAQLATSLDQAPIHVVVGSEQFTVQPSTVGYDVDVNATVQRARADGRGSNPVAVVSGTVLRRLRPDRVPLAVHYDNARMEGLLDGWANAVDRGVVEGDLQFNGTQVVAIEPRTGTGLQRDAARRELERYLGHADRRHPVILPVGPVSPAVDRAAVDAAAARARALLSGSFVVNTNGEKVTITPVQLASMLGTRATDGRLDLTVDSAKLGTALGPAVTHLEHPPVDATFSVSSTNTVSIVPSQDGMEIDLDAVGRAILAGQRVIDAPVHSVHPAHDTAWAQKLGITEQVSSFTTYFTAGQPRVHNIALAASVLNSTVVEPGQTFSLNDRLGQRTPERGYVKAPILVEDGFGEDYGGGISQLTTTLYNAVFFGGYVDVDHSPHRFYISRYPMGREATIVWPYVDLKFRNDTDHGVLIRATTAATSVTVTFYGNNDGRIVHEQNRKIDKTVPITDQTVPCPTSNPTVQDPNNICGHLRAGQKQQSQSGETGYDVEFDRVIDQPGRPEFRQHYYVSYPMLPNTVLVGAGAPTTTTGPSSPTTGRAPATTTPTTQRHT